MPRGADEPTYAQLRTHARDTHHLEPVSPSLGLAADFYGRKMSEDIREGTVVAVVGVSLGSRRKESAGISCPTQLLHVL